MTDDERIRDRCEPHMQRLFTFFRDRLGREIFGDDNLIHAACVELEYANLTRRGCMNAVERQHPNFAEKIHALREEMARILDRAGEYEECEKGEET